MGRKVRIGLWRTLLATALLSGVLNAVALADGPTGCPQGESCAAPNYFDSCSRCCDNLGQCTTCCATFTPGSTGHERCMAYCNAEFPNEYTVARLFRMGNCPIKDVCFHPLWRLIYSGEEVHRACGSLGCRLEMPSEPR